MARQLRIAGTEGAKIREVAEAAEAYQEAKKARMELSKKEVATKATLIEKMKANKIKTYHDEDASPPLVVELIAGELTVKVKEVSIDDGSDPDDNE